MKFDSYYLNSYGRVPLLTAKEEIILARAIQLGNSPDATERMKRVGLKAKNRMIQANMRLAVTLARQYVFKCKSLELPDLVHEAAIGLSQAASKFDPSRGYKFSTYAYWWIRQSIIRAICGQDQSIRLPVNVAESLSRMRRLTEKAVAEGRPITSREAAMAANIQVQNAEAAVLASGVHSLNYSKNGIDSEIIDLLPAPSPEGYSDDLGVDGEDLLGIIGELPSHQAYVVSAFFGLHDMEPQSLTRIGKDLGVSRQVVANHKEKAFRRIRHSLHVRHGITA